MSKLTEAQWRVIEVLYGGGSVIWAFGHEGKFWATPNWRESGGSEIYGFFIAQRFVYPMNHSGLINISDPTFRRDLSLTETGKQLARERFGQQKPREEK